MAIPRSSRRTVFAKLAAAVENGADMAVMGFHAKDPAGYGRLITTEAGELIAIREEKEATPEERALTLCNSGHHGL